MLPAVLLLLGTGLISYALWELRRFSRALGETEPVLRGAAGRLTDLLADLDEAVLAVDRRTERLEELLSLAAERLVELRQYEIVQPGPDEPAPAGTDPAASALPGVGPSAGPLPAGGGAGSLQERVVALADQGLDEEGIAGRLGIPRGEVRLILNLRPIREPGVHTPRASGLPPGGAVGP